MRKSRKFNFYNDNIDNPFPYLVGHVDFPEWWYLTVYAENGDYAEYEQYTLSIQNTPSLKFSLFPNPVINEFFVSIYLISEKINLKIYNILGEIVMSNNNYKSGSYINIQHLKSGIYFVSIKDTFGNTSVKKLIKK